MVEVTNSALLYQLKALGAVGKQANRVVLASTAAIADALQGMNGLTQVVAAFRALGRTIQPVLGPAVQGAQPTPAAPPLTLSAAPAVAGAIGGGAMPSRVTTAGRSGVPAAGGLAAAADAAAAGGGAAITAATAVHTTSTAAAATTTTTTSASAACFYPLHAPFPTIIPTTTLTDKQRTSRKWSLHSQCKGVLPRQAPLKAELGPFKDWCLTPVDLSRDGDAHIKAVTYTDVEKTVSKFLGYCRTYHHLTDAYMSLRLFSNQVGVRAGVCLGCIGALLCIALTPSPCHAGAADQVHRLHACQVRVDAAHHQHAQPLQAGPPLPESQRRKRWRRHTQGTWWG